jgi:hypothetical protein
VQVVEQHEPFPFELVPAFNLGRLPAVRNDRDLEVAAARFLGFTAVVQRVKGTLSGDGVLVSEPKLPIQFIRGRLKGARQEATVFGALDGRVALDGPWPKRESVDEVVDAIVASLYEPRRRLDGTPTEVPAQIQHFACHLDTTAHLSDDHTLMLATDRGGRRPVTLAQIRDGYDDRIYSSDPDGARRDRAVVVMNACASSRTDPSTANSFAQWFLAHGHRAFVGTETDVPDQIAAHFALRFYKRLLDERTLGDSLVWARRDLLRDLGNPLGLLYVLYGDPDLHIQARGRPRANLSS